MPLKSKYIKYAPTENGTAYVCGAMIHTGESDEAQHQLPSRDTLSRHLYPHLVMPLRAADIC